MWFLGLLAICGWLQWCNWRTYNQRRGLLGAYIAAGPEYPFRLPASYDRHLWRLLTFRDWRDLYPKRLTQGL